MNDTRCATAIMAAVPVGRLVFDLGVFNVLWFDDFTAAAVLGHPPARRPRIGPCGS
jgi:hypothetical protein